MIQFFSFLKLLIVCGMVVFVVMLVLLALPQSRLRCVGLEMAKWALACGLLLLLPSPVDVIPDVVPVIGWADDLVYIVGAIASIRGALQERRKRVLLEEIEVNQLRARTSGGARAD